MSADPLVELWEQVAHIPSLLGRIVYIASLWNSQTGRYDRGFADADKALAKWHHAFFVEWLALPLPEKESDVALYWRTSGGSRDEIERHGEAAIPPLVHEEERRMFVQDLSIIVRLL